MYRRTLIQFFRTFQEFSNKPMFSVDFGNFLRIKRVTYKAACVSSSPASLYIDFGFIEKFYRGMRTRGFGFCEWMAEIDMADTCLDPIPTHWGKAAYALWAPLSYFHSIHSSSNSLTHLPLSQAKNRREDGMTLNLNSIQDDEEKKSVKERVQKSA